MQICSTTFNSLLLLNLFKSHLIVVKKQCSAFYLKIFLSISEALRRYVDEPDFLSANA